MWLQKDLKIRELNVLVGEYSKTRRWLCKGPEVTQCSMCVGNRGTTAITRRLVVGEGEEGRGWTLGSLADSGIMFQLHPEATGCLWRLVSWGASWPDLYF